MRSKAVRVIVALLCAVLVLSLLLSLSLCSRPSRGEYESEYGTRYRIDGEALARLDVTTELSVGTAVKEVTVNVVYGYEVYTEALESRILMRLKGIEYDGKDQNVKNLVDSFNRDVKSGGSDIYAFGTITLKAETNGEYARGWGTVRINGELLRKK